MMLPQVLLDGVTRGCVAALLGAGIALPFTVGRFFHFAHGALCVLGVYLVIALIAIGWSPVLALAVGLVLACLTTVAVDALIYEPLRARKAGPSALLIGSLGAFAVIESGIGLFWGAAERSLRGGLSHRIEIGVGVGLTSVQATQIVLTLLLFAAMAFTWRTTQIGLRWRACGEDPTLSVLFGVSVARETRLALVVGTGAGVLGSYLMVLETSVYPAMGFKLLLAGVLAAVIGGLSRPVAALWGGLLVGILQQVVAVYVSYRWESAIVFGLLLVFLLVRPQGIWGERIRAEAA